MALKFRQALEADVWTLMSLYQAVGSTFTNDPLFLDYDKLKASVLAADSFWLIGEHDNSIATTISVLIDPEQGLAKISRIVVNPALPSIKQDLRDSIRYLIQYFSNDRADVDVIYCTTMTIPRNFQELTLDEGFKILGIFPNAIGADSTRLNGLTAYYLRDILKTKRIGEFSVHPSIYPFFKISRDQLGLVDLPKSVPPVLRDSKTGETFESFETLDSLEVIDAPLFVAAQFEKLKSERRQMTDFYPFHTPNILVTSPKGDLRVFAKVFRNSNSAALIGEDLMVSVNPAQLFERVVHLLRHRENIFYFEMLNDAADTIGNQWLLDASLVPCCYIPAFKKQNERRRDYVVFCKAFEYVCRPDLNLQPAFLDFFREFFALEWNKYTSPAGS